jgi:hypothetical protein
LWGLSTLLPSDIICNIISVFCANLTGNLSIVHSKHELAQKISKYAFMAEMMLSVGFFFIHFFFHFA